MRENERTRHDRQRTGFKDQKRVDGRDQQEQYNHTAINPKAFDFFCSFCSFNIDIERKMITFVSYRIRTGLIKNINHEKRKKITIEVQQRHFCRGS